MTQVFTNQVADGISLIYTPSDPFGKHSYPIKTVTIDGTFNGGSVQPQYRPAQAVSGTEWMPWGNAFIAPGTTNLLFKSAQIRLVLTGGGGGANLNAWIDD